MVHYEEMKERWIVVVVMTDNLDLKEVVHSSVGWYE